MPVKAEIAAKVASNILEYIQPILMNLHAESKKQTKGKLLTHQQSANKLEEGTRQLLACISDKNNPIESLAHLLVVAYLNQKSLLAENHTLKNLQSAVGLCVQDKEVLKILSEYRGMADREGSAACIQKLSQYLASALTSKDYTRVVDNLVELHDRCVSPVSRGQEKLKQSR